MALRQSKMTTTRRTNLKLLIREFGGPSSLAKKLEHSGPSYLSQLANGHRPITEKTARGMEAALNLPVGWLDREPGGSKMQPQSKVDATLISEVVILVGTCLEEKGLNVPATKFSEIVALVYEHALAGELDETYVRKLIKLTT